MSATDTTIETIATIETIEEPMPTMTTAELDPVLADLLAGRPAACDAAPTVADLRRNHRAQVETYTPEPTRRPALVEAREVPTRDGARVPVRVYRSEHPAAGAPLPTILWIHGGGWVTGDLDTADPAAREIASAGAVVVSVGYRCAPEQPFPVPVHDCLDAMAWVVRNVADLGGDASRLGVGGDSAGGNLAAVVAQQHPWRDALAAQLLVYPMMDARGDVGPYPSRGRADEHPLFTLPAIEQLSGYYLRSGGRAEDALASPILSRDLGGLAPAIVLSVGHDPLQDEDVAYARRLAEQGVRVAHRDAPDLAHGVVDLIGSVPRARAFFDAAIDEFLDLLAEGRPGSAA